MREILFKAKRLDNGEWVEGYYWVNSLNNHLIKVVKHKADTFTIDDYEVDPNTLCQFTGVNDINNNKIWENDIVDFSEDDDFQAYSPAGYKASIFLVEWDNFVTGFNPFVDYDCDCGIYHDPWHSKVIGNKFDNFELLEGEYDNE